jgi:hypothetical protein
MHPREGGIVMDLETGAEDDRVEIALGAVGSDDRARANLIDVVRDELGVGASQRRVVPVRERDPLAADRVARGEPRPQVRVGYLVTEMASGDRLERLREAAVDDRGEDGRLVAQVHRGADELLDGRQALE